MLSLANAVCSVFMVKTLLLMDDSLRVSFPRWSIRAQSALFINQIGILIIYAVGKMNRRIS